MSTDGEGRRIYVVGHRNPDTDSVAAAMGYAALRRAKGDTHVQAAVAGGLNPQSRYVLQRLGLEAPLFLADVFPRVRDLLRGEPVTVEAETPLRLALELFHRHAIRVLPVVDDQQRPCGLVSLLKLSERYLAEGASGSREIRTTLAALQQSLGAACLEGDGSRLPDVCQLFVGAMSEASFLARIEGHAPASLLIITGDRPAIQDLAVERGVGVLVVTGGFPVSERLRGRARETGTTLLSTPHDSATAAWLARLSTPVGQFVEGGFVQVALGDRLEQLRAHLLHSGEPAVLVVDEAGRLAGVATKSTLLAPIPYALVLVDHNELGQAVYGAEGVDILEVIDHHKLGNPPTSTPISFTVAPVGSTSTLVACRYRDAGLVPDPAIAGVLLAGILSDTVLLKSPTTTLVDMEMVAWLEGPSGLAAETYGREIFAAGSGFSAYASAADAVRADFKHFTAAGLRFGVGQVEVADFSELANLSQKLLEVLEQVRAADRLALAGLMVTDIYSETTRLLVTSLTGLEQVMGYPKVAAGTFELRGVMSRKKQLVPHLMKVLTQLGSAAAPAAI